MKTSRLELRLGPELREKLDALSALTGTSASRTVRTLILSAHRHAFGDARPAVDPARRTNAASIALTVDADDESNLSTDEILARACIPVETGNAREQTQASTDERLDGGAR